ncbi:hypothetical protein [Phaeobacter sp. C3_T13_0]|uniref:hypothetical protein n=1 Tax=Phaeobacter cretensis TaxID=3342641 RepID=UPI0039BCA0C4
MKKALMVGVTDPEALVRSRAPRSGSDALRITRNGVETHRTFAGSFLADSFGAPVQHIAFACNDTIETAQALERNSYNPLSIPENYRADLASRFDLSTGQMAVLQHDNILYDASSSGEFFHFYSKPFAGEMFFEVSQRKNRYEGYGAPNAPFRIAAQKRFMRPKGMPRK